MCCCCDEKTAVGSLVVGIGVAIFLWYNLHAIFALFVILASIGFGSLLIGLVVILIAQKHMTYLWVRSPSATDGTVPYRVQVTGGQDGRMGTLVEPGAPRRLSAAPQRASTTAEIEDYLAQRQASPRSELVRLHHRLRGPAHASREDRRHE